MFLWSTISHCHPDVEKISDLNASFPTHHPRPVLRDRFQSDKARHFVDDLIGHFRPSSQDLRSESGEPASRPSRLQRILLQLGRQYAQFNRRPGSVRGNLHLTTYSAVVSFIRPTYYPSYCLSEIFLFLFLFFFVLCFSFFRILKGSAQAVL